MKDGIETCKETDGFYDSKDIACKNCQKASRHLCKMYAVRRGLKTEEDLADNTDATKIAALFFKGK